MASKDQRVEWIKAYVMSCGGTEEQADEIAERQAAGNESVSVIGRSFSTVVGWREFFIGNFTCWNEYFGWKLVAGDAFLDKLADDALQRGEIDPSYYCDDVEYAKRCYRRLVEVVYLDAGSPFFSDVWRHVPPEIADQCCEAVQSRIKQGI